MLEGDRFSNKTFWNKGEKKNNNKQKNKNKSSDSKARSGTMDF